MVYGWVEEKQACMNLIRVQRFMHNNIMSDRFINVMFTMIDFMI